MAPKRKIEKVQPLVEKQARILDELELFLVDTWPDTSTAPEEVARALRFVHHHLFEPDLNVNRVKAESGIRSTNISAQFRAQTGLTIREYIEHLRLQAARRLLQGPELEIYLIALAIGYQHLETFYRAFRRLFGCTPVEYREPQS